MSGPLKCERVRQDQLAVLLLGDLAAIHEELANPDLVLRRLVVAALGRAHHEPAGRNADHLGAGLRGDDLRRRAHRRRGRLDRAAGEAGGQRQKGKRGRRKAAASNKAYHGWSFFSGAQCGSLLHLPS